MDEPREGRKKRKRLGSRSSVYQITTHHLIPRSRLSVDEKKSLGRKNLKRIPFWKHDLWHRVFSNMTPFEAACCIVENLAKDKIIKATIIAESLDTVYEYRFNNQRYNPGQFVAEHKFGQKRQRHLARLFKEKSFIEMITEIIMAWAPEDYFSHVYIEMIAGEKILTFEYSKGEKK